MLVFVCLCCIAAHSEEAMKTLKVLAALLAADAAPLTTLLFHDGIHSMHLSCSLAKIRLDPSSLCLAELFTRAHGGSQHLHTSNSATPGRVDARCWVSDHSL